MVFPLIVGKLAGGVIGIVLAVWLAVPYARVLEAADRADGTIEAHEYDAQVHGHKERHDDAEATTGALAGKADGGPARERDSEINDGSQPASRA